MSPVALKKNPAASSEPSRPRPRIQAPSSSPAPENGSTTREIKLSDLTDRLQVRVRTDGATIDSYAEAIHDGRELPKPVVYEMPDGSIVLADGNHTVAAFEKLRKDVVVCCVLRGTRLDALSYAARTNAGHGLPLTNADKRRALTMFFAEPGAKELSDAVIATKCAVTGRFVGLVRKELGAASDVRVTKKGRKIKTGKIGARPTLNGSESAARFLRAPLPARQLHERGLLGRDEVVALGTWVADHPDKAPLKKFVDAAEKLLAHPSTRSMNEETSRGLRERVTAGVYHFLKSNASNSNGEADPKTTPDTACFAPVSMLLSVGAKPVPLPIPGTQRRVCVTSISVPREALEALVKALADTADDGTSSAPGEHKSINFDRRRRHNLVTITVGTVTLVVK